ncbi:MAG: hypothetical protein PF486_10950 [Prolixibacteraceae bacterium]|jgi:hypothetical protein|nr:hypothetical protein [Prolixibacteraceae bacterium]
MKNKSIEYLLKLKALIFSIGIIFILQACEKSEIIDNEKKIIKEELFQDNEYNRDFSDFAKAVSNALKNNTSFRKIIKDEALLMIDGDYDVILKRVINKDVTPSTALKSMNVNYTVKELLEDSYYTSSQTKLKSTSSSVIDELSNKYPDMQIAIPVHAADWDETNYIPVVTFLPSGYEEGITKKVTGYDPQGNIVSIDAVNEPDEAIIVISENERFVELGPDPDHPLVVPTPSSLNGIITESGIRLNWDMPNGTNRFNTSGYYVYRKSADSPNYVKVSTCWGTYERSYDDNDVVANRSYSYYVRAYYQGETSSSSNYITLTAPSYPKPVLSFDAIQNSINEIELRWQNDHSQYIQETKISKHVVGVNNGYQLIESFTANEQDYFDHDVAVGKKVIYKINHVTSLGISNAKYDFVQVPYRDISQNSPVYINEIRHNDWELEGWLKGKPEFYITVTNVDNGGENPYTVQEEINCEFSSRSFSSGSLSGIKVIDWKPGFWYDMLTFTAIEYDRPSGDLTLNASVGYNKKNEDKTGLNVAAGVEYEIEFSNNGQKCGSAYLNYFDNPEQWLEFPNYGFKILISEED